MSSFVIDKKEYTKAAGFLAAVIETKNYYREPVMYLWNRREHRPYEAEDVGCWGSFDALGTDGEEG